MTMDSVMSVINTWKDLIIDVFGKYPLAGALVTLVAVGAWVYLEKIRPRKRVSNTLLILLGWAIAVPILGAALWLLGEIWSFIKAVIGPAADVLASLFSIYDKHPFLVLILVIIAIGVYFGWKRWKPNLLPSRLLRVVILTVAVTVFAHIMSPIVGIFTQESSEESEPAETTAKPPAETPSSTDQTQVTPAPAPDTNTSTLPDKDEPATDKP